MSPDAFKRLASAGLSTDQIALVMEIMGEAGTEAEAKLEEHRAKGRARYQRWAATHKPNVRKRSPTLANADKRPARAEDKTLTTVIEPQEDKNSASRRDPTPLDHLLTVLDDTRAHAVIEHRKVLKKPLTAHGAALLARKFAQCSDPNAGADAMVEGGWQGFKPEWMESRQSTARAGPPSNPIRDVISNLRHEIREATSDGRTSEIGPDRPPHVRLLTGGRQGE